MKSAIVIGVLIVIAGGMYYYAAVIQGPGDPNNTLTPPETPRTPLIQANGNSLTTQGDIVFIEPSETDLSLQELFKTVENSVVQVTTRSETLGGGGVGSAFIFDHDGHVITNFHVVDDTDRIDITFQDGAIYRAVVVGSDPYSDLAVIRVDTPRDKLFPLPLADSSKLQVGDQVAAIGNPFGLSGSMTTGIVSQLGRLLPLTEARGFSIPNIIQTDAAINPGNSGGPLLNLRGEVVGVNSAIRSPTEGFSGIGFAIPSNTVSSVAQALINDGVYKHPWLGVSGRDVTPEIADELGLEKALGFLVVDVVENSPASKSGLKGGEREVTLDGMQVILGGDVIIQIDDLEIRKLDDVLVYLERERFVGDELLLTIIRDGETIDLSVILGERPDPFESP